MKWKKMFSHFSKKIMVCTDSLLLNWRKILKTLFVVEYQSEDNIKSVLEAILLAMGFCFTPAGFINTIVSEKKLRIKQQQVISGINIFVYWAANFIWDVFTMLIPIGKYFFFLFRLAFSIVGHTLIEFQYLFFGEVLTGTTHSIS
jgi:hypothetical protein